MKRFFVFLFLAITAFSSSAYSQEKNDYPFQSGEKLNFVMNYTWGGVVTDVGAATCQVTYSDGYYTQKISVGRIISAEDMEKIVTGSRHVDIEFDCFGKVTTCYVVDDNK